MSNPLSDRRLELYRLGGLPESDRREIAARLEREPELRERVAALAASDREVLAHYPAPAMAEAIRRRAAADAPAGPRVSRPVWGLAAAAVLFVLAVPLWRSLAPDATRTKGADQALYVYRRTASGAELLPDRGTARPGDLLQLAYFVRGAGTVVILSLDGRGQVTLHVPQPGATPPAAGRRTLLPDAYELDDAPGFERFILLWSAQPFAAADAVRAAESLAEDAGLAMTAPLPLPGEVRQASVLIRKEPPR